MEAEKMRKAVLAVSVFLVMCGPAWAVDSNGLISHWKFDEGEGSTAYDSSGDNDGTLVNGPVWTTGVLDGALEFDGINDYVTVPDDPSLNVTGDITISAWMYLARGGTGEDGSEQAIVTKCSGTGATNNPFDFRTNISVVPRLAFCRADASGHEHIYSTEAVPILEWHHVLVRVENKVPDFYIDGALSGKTGHTTFTITPTANPKPVLIDRRDDGLHLAGSIDDVRIYNRALSAEEIRQLYEEGLAAVANSYMFMSDQSTVVQTGGIGGIHETHTIEGYFVLTVDFDANVAWFERVDANLSESVYLPTQSLGELFQMTELVSTEVNETAIEFEDTNPPLGGVDIHIRVTFEDDSVHLIGQRFEPWPDGYTYDLDAIAWKWAEVEIVPPKPTSRDVVAITLSGIWGDSCIPTDSNVAVMGNDIYFDVIGVNDPNFVCTQVPTPWQLTESVGPLSLGTYTVYARVIGYTFAPDMYMWMAEFPVRELVYYVDGVNGSDDNDGLSPETAFATVQKGIDTAEDGDTVLVYPAVYTEAVNFDGKAITVQGTATTAGAAVIESPMDYAVSFYTGEEPNSILKNFVIRDSFLAVFIAGASPTISNLTVVDNDFGIAAYAGAQPDISNCIFFNNTDGDLFGCEAQYSWTQEGLGPVTEGLISYWKFDEGSGSTAYDSAGDNDGAISGAQWTEGQVRGALEFDGVNDYVNIGKPESLANLGTATVAMWFKPDSTIDTTLGAWVPLFEKNGTGAAYNGDMILCFLPSWRVHPGVLTLDITNDTGEQFAIYSDSNSWPGGVWQHMAVTWDNVTGAMRMFINSKQQADGLDDFTGVTMSVDRDVTIGSNSEKTDYWWDGVIDEVAIWDRALPAEEVQEVYQFGSGPMFADAAGGDYHLKSERGRYWPAYDVWVLDDVTSPCVDGGDPAANPGDERMPNGGRINMGTYGGTGYASMSEWPIQEDNNRDGIVNMIDFAMLADKWLQKLDWAE